MGRDKRNENRAEHHTILVRSVMESDAWKALPPVAQALYPWLRLEWRGPKFNNNGRIRLSVRQAADRMGVGINTAARAFHDLQAKGFIHVTEGARLGLGGEAKSPCFELTEIAVPNSTERGGRKLFLQWQSGADFPITKAAAHNAGGSARKTKPCHQNEDSTVVKLVTKREGTSPK